MANKKKEDRRIRQTRKRLQVALIQLLKEKPLAKIQIKEICAVADVSRPTFYKHFETKEKLLFSHIDDLFNTVSEAVLSEVIDGDMIHLPRLLIASYEQWQMYHEAFKWVMQVDNKDMLINALRTHLDALKQEFDKHLPFLESLQGYEEHMMSFVSGGLYMLLKTWINNDMDESPERMAHITFLLLYNGFSPIRAKISPDDVAVTYAINQLHTDI